MNTALAWASRLPSTQHLQMWVKRVVVASLHFFISWKYQQTPEASKKKKNGNKQTGRVTAGKGAADFYTSYVAPVTSCVYNNWKAGLLNSFDVSTSSMKVALALSAKSRLTGITIHQDWQHHSQNHPKTIGTQMMQLWKTRKFLHFYKTLGILFRSITAITITWVSHLLKGCYRYPSKKAAMPLPQIMKYFQYIKYINIHLIHTYCFFL